MEEPKTGAVQILLTSYEDLVLMQSLGAGEDSCPIDPWIVVPDRSKYVDQQTLKLQETPEDVPTGDLPRNMLLSVDHHLVQAIVLGTSHKGAVAIRQRYIRVVGIQEANETDSRCPANFTADEIGEFKKFSSEGNAYQNICCKIAPSIFGNDDVKKAVACLLFGGSRKAQGYKLKSKSLEAVLKLTRKMEAKLIGYDEAPIAVTAPVAIPLEKLELQEPSRKSNLKCTPLSKILKDILSQHQIHKKTSTCS